MKKFFFVLWVICSMACRENTEPKTIVSGMEADTAVNFFPVTEYVLGQIKILKSTPINPLKITSVGNTIDSVWLKREEIEQEMQLFLTPEIDSTNLMPYYNQSRFLDQTLNRVTLSYDLQAQPQSNYPWKRWDVYINPKTGEVTLLYMVKQPDPDNEVQLSWQAGRYCQMLYLNRAPGDKMEVVKKTVIQWDFEDEL